MIKYENSSGYWALRIQKDCRLTFSAETKSSQINTSDEIGIANLKQSVGHSGDHYQWKKR